MRAIEAGDKVTAYWTKDSAELTGVVKSMPAATGDMIYIEDGNGSIHAINPSCSDFEGLIKKEGEAE